MNNAKCLNRTTSLNAFIDNPPKFERDFRRKYFTLCWKILNITISRIKITTKDPYPAVSVECDLTNLSRNKVADMKTGDYVWLGN